MFVKKIFPLLLICIASAGVVTATAKKKAKTNMRLVTAYTRSITEDEQTNPPMAGTFIVVRWETVTYPESIFWRGENGWLSCLIEKAKSSVVNGKTVFTPVEIALDQVSKGDTLLLTPIKGGRFPIPAEIPETSKNTLFYKTGNSNWLSFPVKSIHKK